MRVSAWSFGHLKFFVGEKSLEPPPHLATTDLKRQVEDVFTVFTFIFSTQIVFQLLIFLFWIYCFMHTDWQDNHKLKNCAGIIKNDVEFWLNLITRTRTMTFTGLFFFRKLSLEYAFGSSSTKLKLLVILVIFFIIWFWTSRPNGINAVDEQGSAGIRIWIWKIGKI